MEEDIMNCISTKLKASHPPQAVAGQQTSNPNPVTPSSVPQKVTPYTDVDDYYADEHDEQDGHDHKDTPSNQENLRHFVLQKLIEMLTCYEETLSVKKRLSNYKTFWLNTRNNDC